MEGGFAHLVGLSAVDLCVYGGLLMVRSSERVLRCLSTDVWVYIRVGQEQRQDIESELI